MTFVDSNISFKKNSGGVVQIGGSVGQGGANDPADVRVVQALLNNNMPVPLRLLELTGICDTQMTFAIMTYQRRVVGSQNPDGRVDPGGATIRSLSGISSYPTPPKPSTPTSGRLYTNDPNEVVTTTTTPTVRQVRDMLLSEWSDLNENGARTLTAQFMAETGGGKYCFNWNLGNAKSVRPQSEKHMYLRNVWECAGQTDADAAVAKAHGLARIAAADEIRQHGWKCPNVVVVFDPPHPACRFRAYDSLKDGAQRWLGIHQKIARGDPGYLTALNSGDVNGAARALKHAKYYTAGEKDYALAMTRTKKTVDQQLGPV